MSQLIAMIVRIDDLNKPEELSELWRQPLPPVNLAGLEGERYWDALEEQVTEVDTVISVKHSEELDQKVSPT